MSKIPSEEELKQPVAWMKRSEIQERGYSPPGFRYASSRLHSLYWNGDKLEFMAELSQRMNNLAAEGQFSPWQ